MTTTVPMSEIFVQWGERVAARRDDLKMTQRQLADACEVTTTTISRIERGLETPRIALMARIAKALHQEIERLFPYPKIDWNA